jgi:transporter family-2 protein
MFYFLSLLAGILVSVMVAFNGELSEQYGANTATVIIHIAGLTLVIALLLIRRANPFSHKRQAWYFYLGGLIGVATTTLTNFAFFSISVSEILALGLLGQGITGLIVDQTGWLGMPKHPFKKHKVIGLIFIFSGIIVMTRNFALIPVLAAFATGITVVTSRTLNAKLTEYTNAKTSTFYNYVVGLLVAFPVFLLLSGGEPRFADFAITPNNFFIYLGGPLGACIVLISNLVVAKVPAFYLSLLMFVGQVFTGVLIDALLDGSFSMQIFIGGVLVTAGLCADLILDKKHAEKTT